MNQKEKSQLSKDKILKAAILEFGTKTYENASLNSICSEHSISKGLIYHYFKNKDELYLSCVGACFAAFTSHLKSVKINSSDIQADIQAYLDLRHVFFHDNPNYSNIFFNAVLQPPPHLADSIRAIGAEFDGLNASHYKAAISKIELRRGITEEEAVEYFLMFQEMFHQHFQSKAYENGDFGALIESHELKLSKILNIMLYGIIKEDI